VLPLISRLPLLLDELPPSEPAMPAPVPPEVLPSAPETPAAKLLPC